MIGTEKVQTNEVVISIRSYSDNEPWGYTYIVVHILRFYLINALLPHRVSCHLHLRIDYGMYI